MEERRLGRPYSPRKHMRNKTEKCSFAVVRREKLIGKEFVGRSQSFVEGRKIMLDSLRVYFWNG